MDKSFAHYYSPTEDEFKAIWKDCIFIFDTNVLLNIYEYSEENRNIFFDVLRTLKKRIWIPYHVGLEFHRNRFSRIRNAGSTLNDLKKGVETALVTLSGACDSPISQLKKKKIDIKQISERIDEIQSIGKSLLESIATAKETLPRASMSDEIGKKVSELFTGKVGERPATQDDLQKLIADADVRMEHNIPPGFEDKGKGGATFHDHGIRYSNKHGDLIIWKQIIAHAKEDNSQSVVFVTGDSKNDWWLCEGPLTVGPRVELIQEIITEAGIPHFWMYNVEKFLEHSRDILDFKEVTDGVIEQSKNIAINKTHNEIQKIIFEKTTFEIDQHEKHCNQPPRDMQDFRERALEAFAEWLHSNHPAFEQCDTRDYDFIALMEGAPTTFEICTISNSFGMRYKILRMFQGKNIRLSEKNTEQLMKRCLVIAFTSHELLSLQGSAIDTILNLDKSKNPAYHSVIIGSVSHDNKFENVSIFSTS